MTHLAIYYPAASNGVSNWNIYNLPEGWVIKPSDLIMENAPLYTICLEEEAEIENIGCDETLSVTYFGI